MSRVLEATCVAGVVTADGVLVPAADILSEGVAASEGVLILDEDRAKYLAKTSSDLKSTLDKIATALTTLVTALTAIDAKPVGPLPPAPVAAASILQLTALQVEVTLLKETLK